MNPGHRIAPSFPMLIDGIIRAHHDGAEGRMHLFSVRKRRKLALSTISRWRRAPARDYDPRLIDNLSALYDINQDLIWEVIEEDREKIRRGREVPLPDLGDVKRGPIAMSDDRRRRRSRKAVASMLAGASLLGLTATQPVAAATKLDHDGVGSARRIMSTSRKKSHQNSKMRDDKAA